jgi:hypothetical protein
MPVERCTQRVRFIEYVESVFSRVDGSGCLFRLWKEALREYDELEGIDWG